MRCIDNHEERERVYRDELIDIYMRKYEALSKYMVDDYKRQITASFLTERYCHENAEKYTGKYKDLIEESLYSEEDWYKMRYTLKKIADEKISQLQTNLPFSIRKAAANLHDNFKKFLEVQDLDEQT
eukprot:CAMPEP_0170474968 /NCGR_PEP_ID=MMETSP0123-20130129/16700_1 /TAXON_ID=182087 /ORGANISM="Favella ehrenbergii, Strain Fehren 1" /LENGTH=126 /DNA_ID=CAMNT_0010745171 /DNA_START=282 /DNA_END=662 /DNA_ORIENTATION=+